MVVTSRCFAFCMLITQAQIWKRFWVENPTSLYYSPIPSSAETWKKNPYFGKYLICKTRADYACKTSRLLRISLLISATTKSCIFSRESWFIKAIEIFFSCICIAWYKHLRGWENSRQLSKPSTSSQGLHNKHGKCLLCQQFNSQMKLNQAWNQSQL